MPAIQPARLRQQAALLAEHFEQPAAFIRSLHHLLDGYADRTHRPGQSGEPPPLLAAYHVKPPVLRQVLHELAPYTEEQPQEALALSDALWKQDYLEFRQLAALLIGRVPPYPPGPILQRVRAWAQPVGEEGLVRILLTQGLARLRQAYPEAVFDLVQEWLSDEDTFCKQLGLRALLPVIRDSGFDNLPVLFRLIFPLTRTAAPRLRPDLLDLLAALAERSPQETAFFLRQSLSTPDSPDTAWLIRQSLSSFPAEIQEGLRTTVRDSER